MTTIPADPEAPEETRRDLARRNRADLATALVLMVLAVAIFYLSWTMPRLEARHIHPTTVPGLVPGLLSMVLFLLGGLLALRSWRAPHAGGWQALAALLNTWQAARVGAVFALVLVYTLGLVGWLPFWLASTLFVFAFILVFELALPAGPADLKGTLIWGTIVAIAAGLAISTVFERIFLVRLP